MTLIKKPAIRFMIVVTIILLTASCATTGSNQSYSEALYSVIEAPLSVRNDVVSYAYKYADRNTVYVGGRRDSLEKEGVLEVDRAGLIVRVYQYAVNDTPYSLLFDYTNVGSLYTYFTIPITDPTPGDLVFMGEGWNPTHIGIFIKIENDYIYFIDSNLKDADEILGFDAVNGVTLRHYHKDDYRIFSFARLMIKQENDKK